MAEAPPQVPEARKDGSELRRSAFHGATVEAGKGMRPTRGADDGWDAHVLEDGVRFFHT